MTDLTEDLSSLMNDNSFVILGKGSFTDISYGDNESIDSHQYVSQNSKSLKEGSEDKTKITRMSSMPADVSPDDIQYKLDQLIQENLLLKKTLNETNEVMMKQYDIMEVWHEDLKKTHESHKQKFQETQDQISQLREENLRLKAQIIDKESCNDSVASDLVVVDREKESLEVSVNDLTKQLQPTTKDFSKTVKTNEELNIQIKELEIKLNRAEDEKLNLEKKLKEVLEEIRELNRHSDINTLNFIENENIKAIPKSKENKINAKMSVINQSTTNSEGSFAGFHKKEEEVMLKQLLAEQEKVLMETRNEVAALKLYNTEILKDKEMLEGELKKCHVDIEQLRAKFETSNARLKITEELLQNKNKDFDLIKNEMLKLVLDCEEVAILRAQVDLYKSDFNEERKAREQAIGEKEKMAERVRFLERTLNEAEKNRKLKNEQSEGSVENNNTNMTPFMCPKCYKMFKSMSDCDKHLIDCLDSDMFL